MATLSMQYRPRTTRSLAIATGKRETSSALSSPVAIERLRMAPDRFHEPALAREIVDLFSGLPRGVVVDATLGGAGHALAILESAPQLRLLGIDRDPAARAEASMRLAPYGERAVVVNAAFADIDDVLQRESAFLEADPVVGVLMDLGV